MGQQLPERLPPAPSSEATTTPPVKRRLDVVVKLGLGVFIGSFLLIWGGMFLTRPDRSIPPYSIGSQQGTVVAVHVPAWTSDGAIETLIQRFRRVGKEGRDFGRMKIQPTTPEDPRGRYRRIQIYIFTLDTWTEPEMLRRYLAAETSSSANRELREGFEKAVRGYYRLDDSEEEGRIGPILQGAESPANAAHSRVLFRGPVTNGAEAARSPSGAVARVQETARKPVSPYRRTGPTSSSRQASPASQDP
jgi:hypothetical protein